MHQPLTILTETILLALSLALSFVGDVHHVTLSSVFLVFRYFGVPGVCTWQSAYIVNEELHHKSSQGQMPYLCLVLQDVCV